MDSIKLFDKYNCLGYTKSQYFDYKTKPCMYSIHVWTTIYIPIHAFQEFHNIKGFLDYNEMSGRTPNELNEKKREK